MATRTFLLLKDASCFNYDLFFLKPPILPIINNNLNNNNIRRRRRGGAGGAGRCVCSAIAIDAPSSVSHVSDIRWGCARHQGPRDEMEDDLLVIPSPQDSFAFAAVFDGHAGFSSVKFLRNELYRECSRALQGGILTNDDMDTITKALQGAFQTADLKLINWLDTTTGEDVESGSTATAIFINNNMLFISHVGDSSVVLSRCGKAEKLTNSHRPYGSDKVSLQEIKRIREAGGWINNGRICGDIAISRAFGDMRFKTKKKEMLEKGVEEGRWTEKFISRIQFKGDLVSACPDVSQVPLGKDAEFIILASDGLWDYMKSPDVVEFVRNQLRQHGNAQIACEALCQMALDQGSQDNISIIIADLGRTDWKNLPVKKGNVVLEMGQALATMGIVSFGIWMSYQLQL